MWLERKEKALHARLQNQFFAIKVSIDPVHCVYDHHSSFIYIIEVLVLSVINLHLLHYLHRIHYWIVYISSFGLCERAYSFEWATNIATVILSLFLGVLGSTATNKGINIDILIYYAISVVDSFKHRAKNIPKCPAISGS